MDVYSLDRSQVEDNINIAIGCLIDRLEHDGVITGEQAKKIDEGYLINIVKKGTLRERLRGLFFKPDAPDDHVRFVVSKIGTQSFGSNPI